jgi:uncharacterized coiled-coil protein SlyX
MQRPVPTRIVIEMNRRGYKDVDILRFLKQKGYSPVEIGDAFNQAKVKLELSKLANPFPEESIPTEPEQIQKPEPIQLMRQTSDASIQNLSIRLKNLELKQKQQANYFEDLNNQISKNFQENTSRIKELSSQIYALQQSFSKVLEPLAHNVKLVSGALDLKKEEKQAEKIEKEIKKEEKQIKIIEKKPRQKRPKKIIKKTVTVTEIQEPEKEIKKSKKKEPSIDDVF